jgi:hypothetical protein
VDAVGAFAPYLETANPGTAVITYRRRGGARSIAAAGSDQRLTREQTCGSPPYPRSAVSLLLTLVKRGILSLDDAVETLECVVEAKQAEADEKHSEVYRTAAKIVEHITSSVAAAQTRDPVRVMKETSP